MLWIWTCGLASGETIHTENSYKFTDQRVAALLTRAGFRLRQQWSDANQVVHGVPGGRGAPHPRSPVKLSGFRAPHEAFPVQRCAQDTRMGYSSTATGIRPGGKGATSGRPPHLANNERDMGHPGFVAGQDSKHQCPGFNSVRSLLFCLTSLAEQNYAVTGYGCGVAALKFSQVLCLPDVSRLCGTSETYVAQLQRDRAAECRRG